MNSLCHLNSVLANTCFAVQVPLISHSPSGSALTTSCHCFPLHLHGVDYTPCHHHSPFLSPSTWLSVYPISPTPLSPASPLSPQSRTMEMMYSVIAKALRSREGACGAHRSRQSPRLRASPRTPPSTAPLSAARHAGRGGEGSSRVEAREGEAVRIVEREGEGGRVHGGTSGYRRDAGGMIAETGRRGGKQAFPVGASEAKGAEIVTTGEIEGDGRRRGAHRGVGEGGARLLRGSVHPLDYLAFFCLVNREEGEGKGGAETAMAPAEEGGGVDAGEGRRHVKNPVLVSSHCRYRWHPAASGVSSLKRPQVPFADSGCMAESTGREEWETWQRTGSLGLGQEKLEGGGARRGCGSSDWLWLPDAPHAQMMVRRAKLIVAMSSSL